MNVEDLPPIKPEEVCLAVIGIQPVISRAVDRVSRAQFLEMANFPATLVKMAKSLCHDGMVELPLTHRNYRTMLKELAEPIGMDQVEAMVQAFPAEEHDLAAAFVAFSGQLVQQLQELYPKSQSQSIAGPRQLVPNDVAIWKFVNLLEVVDDPLRVFNLMGTGSLLKTQVQAIRLVYPTLAKAIDTAIDETVTDERAVKKSYELAPRAEIGVRAWKGVPRIDPGLLAKLQAATQAAKDDRTANRPDPSAPGLMAKSAETSTQKAVFGNQG